MDCARQQFITECLGSHLGTSTAVAEIKEQMFVDRSYCRAPISSLQLWGKQITT